jgi:hypothetical protein
MDDQPILTEAEWRLVVEVLERELHELPSEIHHTDRAILRRQLRRRMERVESILAAIGAKVPA